MTAATQKEIDQRVFNHVVKHLKTQGGPSVFTFADGSISCKYNGENDKHCAIGCLLRGDEQAKVNIERYYEGESAGNLPAQLYKPQFRNANPVMLGALQSIHDGPIKNFGCFGEAAIAGLRAIARSNCLALPEEIK